MASEWKHALIVGASSGMGEALVKQLARQGVSVAMVARRESEMQRIIGELAAQNVTLVPKLYVHDVTETACVPALFAQIAHDLGGLDLVIYAAGVMPAVAPDEYNWDKDNAMIAVNITGAVVWLNQAAMRFERAGAGTLVGIGSVAGDRGRSGNPVYGMTKAALATYLEALRNRIGKRGVKVITIKPGPVDTPMTRGLDKLPLLIPADKAASLILDACRKGKKVAYVPGIWRPIMAIIRAVPSFLFMRQNVIK
jgi:decaprenylphospho-beta-D-erythro-pentofuranosid-2-ulose 2-reductase